MKTFSIYSIVVCMIISLYSCSSDDDGLVTVPFQFEFSSFGGPVQGDSSCGEPPVFLVRQEGEGIDKLLGKFTFVAQFCNNLSTGEYFDGPSTFGYFEDENGDRLQALEIKGQILPSTREGYDLMFQDPVTFEGGTGRFQGATGSGMTDSYVNLEAGRTDHVWRGTITLN